MRNWNSSDAFWVFQPFMTELMWNDWILMQHSSYWLDAIPPFQLLGSMFWYFRSVALEMNACIFFPDFIGFIVTAIIFSVINITKPWNKTHIHGMESKKTKPEWNNMGNNSLDFEICYINAHLIILTMK